MLLLFVLKQTVVLRLNISCVKHVVLLSRFAVILSFCYEFIAETCMRFAQEFIFCC
jgi:hypothetical protein